MRTWLYDGPYAFGMRSATFLETVHPDLQKIAHAAIQLCDFSVISGRRTAEEQQAIFAAGRSKLDGVNDLSKHQADPPALARAMDLMPYSLTDVWSRTTEWYIMAGIVIACANRMNIAIRWGGDWDRDGCTWNNNFDDLGHFELYGR